MLKGGVGRSGLTLPAKSGSSNVVTRIVNIPFVNNNLYEGVFYYIGTKFGTQPYTNAALISDENYRVKFHHGQLYQDSAGLGPFLLLNRPASLTQARAPFHTAQYADYALIVILPPRLKLKLTGFSIQGRTDYEGGYVTQLRVTGCKNTPVLAPMFQDFGTFNTNITTQGVMYTQSNLVSNDYYTSFNFTRLADGYNGYFICPFLEIYGELSIG
jgi:hypothetical protein